MHESEQLLKEMLAQCCLAYRQDLDPRQDLATFSDNAATKTFAIPNFEGKENERARWYARLERYHNETVFACLLAILPPDEKQVAIQVLTQKVDRLKSSANEHPRNLEKIVRCLRDISLTICYFGAPGAQTKYLAVRNAERSFNWLASGQAPGTLDRQLDWVIRAEEKKLEVLMAEINREQLEISVFEPIFSAYRQRLLPELQYVSDGTTNANGSEWEGFQKQFMRGVGRDIVSASKDAACYTLFHMSDSTVKWVPPKDQDKKIFRPLARDVTVKIRAEMAQAEGNDANAEPNFGSKEETELLKGPALAIVLRIGLERWAGNEIFRLFPKPDARKELIWEPLSAIVVQMEKIVNQINNLSDQAGEEAAHTEALTELLVEFVLLDILFHVTIIRFAGVGWMAEFLGELYKQTNLRTQITVRSNKRRQETCEEHRSLIQCLTNDKPRRTLKKDYGIEVEKHLIAKIQAHDKATHNWLCQTVNPMGENLVSIFQAIGDTLSPAGKIADTIGKATATVAPSFDPAPLKHGMGVWSASSVLNCGEWAKDAVNEPMAAYG